MQCYYPDRMLEMMKGKLRPDETELIGNLIRVGGKVIGDENCERIRCLTETYLEKIGFNNFGAWETLYRDPFDGRYWERTYPHSDWHGGGPPMLKNLSREEAEKKYGILSE